MRLYRFSRAASYLAAPLLLLIAMDASAAIDSVGLMDDVLRKFKDNASSWAGPYAKLSELKDPFGHAFGYRFPGEHGAFDLIFYGQDGQPGGEGYSADLGNWE